MGHFHPPFFVISDLHFNHDLIIKHCDRPFDHEQMIVKRWRSTVKPSDTILCLGDVFMGGDEGYDYVAEHIAPRLTGHKYLIRGNHDKKKHNWEKLGFTVVRPFTLRYRNWDVCFDHYPRVLDPQRDYRKMVIHGHVHNHGYGPDQEPHRYGNINVSAEVIDYKPQRVVRLMNNEIARRKHRGRSKRYINIGVKKSRRIYVRS